MEERKRLDAVVLSQGTRCRGRRDEPFGGSPFETAVQRPLQRERIVNEWWPQSYGMELNIHSPVFAGDTIHVEVEVIEARRSRSRPELGLVRTRNDIVKQDGTKAITYTPLRMVKCRSAA